MKHLDIRRLRQVSHQSNQVAEVEGDIVKVITEGSFHEALDR